MQDPQSIPIADIDVSDLHLWQTDTHLPLFERLRREDPVHWCASSAFGSFWSITRFDDIVAVDTNHKDFSSEAALGGIAILDQGEALRLPMFIAMDPPKHDVQRKVVSPIVSPANLALLEPLIRERVGVILDGLPRGEVFDWVDRVSIELTTQMLATLFDFPFESRRKLTYWSDAAAAIPQPGTIVESEAQKLEILQECLAAFTELWNERVNRPPGNDLISMLAHGEATRNMSPEEYLGNVILLIVGGNDTTRNSITGSLVALTENPVQLAKLRADPSLVPSMVSETIRWQTPLAHMRRTAVNDVELAGKVIRKGDKVIMWYVSGNRDAAAIEEPDRFIVDRVQPRRHLSFGFGIHRCVGNRLAEMQLKIVWEEILKRFDGIEIVGAPVRVSSCFVRGYESLLVRIPE